MNSSLSPLLVLLAFLAHGPAVGAQAPLPVWKLQSDRVMGTREKSSSSLSRVGALTVDEARNVIVAQPDSGFIKVFRPDGTLLRQFGKKGTGPGEVNTIAALGRIGDTLLVMDQAGGKGRVHIYDSTFRFLKTVDLALTGLRPTDRPALPLALLKNGHVLTQGAMDPATRQITYAVTDQQGREPHAVLTSAPSRVAVAIPAARVSFPIQELGAYDDYSLMRAAPDGSRLVVVDRTAATDIKQATYRVTVFRADGSQLWSRAYPYTPTPLPSASTDQAIKAAAVANARALGGPIEAERVIRNAIGTLPKFQSPIVAVVLGYDGTIWLAPRSVSNTTSWIVLDQAGTPLATLPLPNTFVFAGAQRGWIWSVASEGNAWFIEQYRIIPK